MTAGRIAGVLSVSLLLLELLVRSFVVSPAAVVFDAELGPMKAPDTVLLRTYEGYARFTTDDFGFNNDALPSSLPKHRLLVLGDSFVEATHVMRENNFVSLLNRRGDTLAYNAGFAGADPRAFPVLARRFQQILAPDLIVLCVNEDDLSALRSVNLPHYQEPTGLKKLLQPLFANSALATHLNWKYKTEIVEWWNGLGQEADLEIDEAGPGPVLPSHLVNWSMVLKQVEQVNAHVLVFFLPSLAYRSEGAVILPSPASDAMIGVAERLHIPVLQANEAFLRDYGESELPAFGFSNTKPGKGHLNDRGHRIVAEILTAYVAGYY